MAMEILYEVCSKNATRVSTYHFQKRGGGEKEARAQGLKGSASFMTRSATTTKIGEPTAVLWTCWYWVVFRQNSSEFEMLVFVNEVRSAREGSF